MCVDHTGAGLVTDAAMCGGSVGYALQLTDVNSKGRRK